MKKIFLLLSIITYTYSMAQLATSPFYGIIMAGGSGKRLWPLSRKHLPKQFVPFIESKTLIEHTISLIDSLIDRNHRWVVTTRAYEKQVASSIGSSIAGIITEPSSRNTGPAILYSLYKIREIDPEALVIFLPSDHHIPQKDAFQQILKEAANYASMHDAIVLLGVTPTCGCSDFGYIEAGQPTAHKAIYHVKTFHEKPDFATANAYCHNPDMLWNIGMFCARVNVFLREFTYCAPSLVTGMAEVFRGAKNYNDLPDVPVDKAVIEKSNNVVVRKTNISWSDVGSLDQFLTIKQASEIKDFKTIEIESKNNLIEVAQKPVVLLDVDDLCVIETNDILFITKRGQTAKIRTVIEELSKNGQEGLI